MKNRFLVWVLMLCFAHLNAQDMKEGFTYLETGKYKDAETYFFKILVDYPDNKTARLCYGRAVGLNGDSKKAVSIFTDLLEAYPSDYEIKLNYAESLLWNKEFNKAKPYYKGLVDENLQSFPALLGYANTLSNLEEFDAALKYVNKALEVSPGNNNALISKKYIRLGFANQYMKKQNYTEAVTILEKNLEEFKNDKESLLSLANVYLNSNELAKAKKTYQLLSNTDEGKIIALNGQALVHHLDGKEKDALLVSEQAYKQLNEISNQNLINQTKERYAQALIWNKKYVPAKRLIDDINKDHPDENWALALRATLNIYKSNFKESIDDYDLILKNDITSFDGNLGKANALKATNAFRQAYDAAKMTLKYHDNQKDALSFIKMLEENFTPFAEHKVAYSFDNGDNSAWSINNSIQYPLSTKLSLHGDYTYRTTRNSNSNNKATANTFNVGFSYRLHPSILFKGQAGLSATSSEINDFNRFLSDLSFKIKPYKLQDLEVGYKRTIESFNADLLAREIVQDNFYANYNVSSNFNLGWFTQYYYTSQNDENTRNLLFTSLYYNILSKPVLKAGVNYQYITFKNQVPTIYFSPEKFNAVEIFVDLLKDENIVKESEWFYGVNLATGYQFINDDEKQSTYRVQGKFGYKFKGGALLNFYGTNSNIASVTAAGFKYTELGLRFKWFIPTKKNVFTK